MEKKKRGGARKNSGRKSKHDSSVRHIKREKVIPSKPMHINMKLVKGIEHIRTKKLYKLFLRSIMLAKLKGLRILHFSILSNHFHLIVEADSNDSLAKGMQSLNISFAKAINKNFERKGRVFETRYFLHVLKNMREVVNSYRYVLKNYAKHLKKADIFDRFSSIHIYKDIRRLFGKVTFNIKRHFKDKEERMIHQKELIQTVSPPKSYMAKKIEKTSLNISE